MGKLKKVALVACMRKLITILNAMIRDHKLWQPAYITVALWFPQRVHYVNPAISTPLLLQSFRPNLRQKSEAIFRPLSDNKPLPPGYK